LKEIFVEAMNEKQEYPETTRTITSLNMVRVKKVEELFFSRENNVLPFFILIDKKSFSLKNSKEMQFTEGK